MDKTEWSDLPEELIDLIASRYSSNIDVLRIRSICEPWRSAVATTKKRFQNRFQRSLPSSKEKIKTLFSPNTFFRVTVPSSSSCKGWLIRTRQASESSKINLLSPLSRQLITPSHQTLDLLNFGVSEIRLSYGIHVFDEGFKFVGSKGVKSPALMLSRVVFLDNPLFAVSHDEKIWWCKSGEESRIWTKIRNQVEKFADIILHRGQIYALDTIWWISLSRLCLIEFTTSTPMDYYEYDSCKDKRLVEYCGDLCIIHQLRARHSLDESAYIERTVGFKVYKMDEDLAKWVEVSSLEDKALIVARDSCFTVVASEYHGCLKNSIYFTDKYGMNGKAGKLIKHDDISSEYKGLLKNYIYFADSDGDQVWNYGMNGEAVKVFKLNDGNIINMTDFSSQSCFHMFSPPFL